MEKTAQNVIQDEENSKEFFLFTSCDQFQDVFDFKPPPRRDVIKKAIKQILRYIFIVEVILLVQRGYEGQGAPLVHL